MKYMSSNIHHYGRRGQNEKKNSQLLAHIDEYPHRQSPIYMTIPPISFAALNSILEVNHIFR